MDAIEVTAADAAAWDAAVTSFRQTRGRNAETTFPLVIGNFHTRQPALLQDSMDGLAGIAALRWSEQ
jgi:hypothetical protein